ncbi:hypothetical protein ALQ18_05178 [Pseudomonas marginalis pv. marginalis]|nr:hypothetical protein ALQ18_05178 [Pseudomonas marginalis pv. marginalis]
MDVCRGKAGEGGFHVPASDGEGQLPVGNIFDAVDTTGEDAVVHTRFTRHGAQQRRVGRFALERQAHDAPWYMGEVITLLAVVDLLGFLYEALGGRVLGVQEHVGHRALLDDDAGVHHRHVVADAADHVHFMGDQHDGQLQLAVDLGQQLQHRRGGLRVEGAGGFVAQQDFWLGRQGAGDADALLLTTRQLRRVFFGVVGQANAGEQLSHTQVDVLARQFAGQRQWQRHVVGNGLGGEQVEVLEDHPDLLAETAQAVGVQGGDFFAVDVNLATAGLLQTVDQTQQGTFSRTGVANKAKHLAVFDAQAGGVQGGDFLTGDAVGFMDVMKLDHVANLVGRMEKGSAVSRARILACPYSVI